MCYYAAPEGQLSTNIPYKLLSIVIRKQTSNKKHIVSLFFKYSFTRNRASDRVFLKENTFAFLCQNFIEFCSLQYTHDAGNTT